MVDVYERVAELGGVKGIPNDRLRAHKITHILPFAIHDKNSAAVQAILESKSIDLEYAKWPALVKQARSTWPRDIEVYHAFRRNADMIATEDELFTWACTIDDYETTQEMLRRTGFVPSQQCLIMGTRYGNLKPIRAILAHRKLDLNENEHQIMYEACRHGDNTIVTMLLNQESLDKPGCSKHAFRGAVDGQKDQIVRTLLRYKGIDPACDDNDPIAYAAREGRVGVVRALLTDPRCDPTKALVPAGTNRLIIRELLKDKRVVEYARSIYCTKCPQKLERKLHRSASTTDAHRLELRQIENEIVENAKAFQTE